MYPLMGTLSDPRESSDMPTTPTIARLGASIRARRISLGLSQSELSDQLGISRSKISAMENGRFGSTKLFFEVAQAMGLEIFVLPREDRTALTIRHQQESTTAAVMGTRIKRSQVP